MQKRPERSEVPGSLIWNLDDLFASLRMSEEGINPKYQAMEGVVAGHMAEVNAAFSFFESEFLAYPQERSSGMQRNNSR